jgi:hypothetical protein
MSSPTVKSKSDDMSVCIKPVHKQDSMQLIETEPNPIQLKSTPGCDVQATCNAPLQFKHLQSSDLQSTYYNESAGDLQLESNCCQFTEAHSSCVQYCSITRTSDDAELTVGDELSSNCQIQSAEVDDGRSVLCEQQSPYESKHVGLTYNKLNKQTTYQTINNYSLTCQDTSEQSTCYQQISEQLTYQYHEITGDSNYQVIVEQQSTSCHEISEQSTYHEITDESTNQVIVDQQSTSCHEISEQSTYHEITDESTYQPIVDQESTYEEVRPNVEARYNHETLRENATTEHQIILKQ